MYPTVILLLVALSAGALAIPTPASLAPRCGSTQAPIFIKQISSDNPSTSYPPSSDVLVEQTAAGGKIDTLFRFENVPSGVWSCSLVATFPSTYPLASSGPATLSVHSLTGQISVGDTWNTWAQNVGAIGPVVGTVTLSQVLGSTVMVASGTCQPDMDYLIEISSWETGAASVEFTQYINALNGQGAAGFFLTYNC
jgi:hypothetical protein